MSADVSVIVCTYNRSALLAQTLESMCGLNVPPGLDWEVLVVDNNSPDDTFDVATNFQKKLPLRCLREPRQGKTFALNRAVAESSGTLTLFTDDDVRLSEDWLVQYVRALRDHPEAGWFGGRIYPWWPSGQPKWLREDGFQMLQGYFVSYDLGDRERLYTAADLLPCGANMAVARRTFELIGGYREDLGPRGNLRGVADDTELIQRAIHLGISGVYVPAAACEHLVPQDRLRFTSFFRYGLLKGEQQARANPTQFGNGSICRSGLDLLRGGCQMLRQRSDRARVCLINSGFQLGIRRAKRALKR